MEATAAESHHSTYGERRPEDIGVDLIDGAAGGLEAGDESLGGGGGGGGGTVEATAEKHRSPCGEDRPEEIRIPLIDGSAGEMEARGEAREEAAPAGGEAVLEASGELPRPADDAEGQREEIGSQPPADAAAADDAAILSDELRSQIVRQVEYYFSDENLPTDAFLLKHVQKNKNGFVSIALIASFRKMKKLVQDLSLVVAALRTSSQLVVSLDGKRVKRLIPLVIPEASDAKQRTVFVENIPEGSSAESLQIIFGKVGIIKNVSIKGPHSMEEPTTQKKAEIAISSKVHALIEYETEEAAQNAVATLNDEKNWRTGLRVELLLKRMGKYGLIQKPRSDTCSDKGNDAQVLDELSNARSQNDDSTKEEQEQLSSQKAARRGRHKSRGTSTFKAASNGIVSTPSSGGEGASKPAPGPRMPDGTRGFSMGRGKPALPPQNASGEACEP